MTAIPIPTFIVHSGGLQLAPGLPEERCVRTADARASLPAGTITIDADECYAVADGTGTFQSTGLDGAFPAHESVVLPAYIIAGPGLPPQIPGGGRELVKQDEVDENLFQFYAIDANGSLHCWDTIGDSFVDFAWETAGQAEAATPVFPLTAWC
ncbi:hypothetical protein [Arthrobacter sp. UYCo732]|uniref:hypothetical protein n=1 Tax=Arthrobacter sp. UYCo732 TaxID=3156336 RepID=UPI003396F1F1